MITTNPSCRELGKAVDVDGYIQSNRFRGAIIVFCLDEHDVSNYCWKRCVPTFLRTEGYILYPSFRKVEDEAVWHEMGGRRYTRKWKSEFRERTGHSAQKPSPWTIERVGERWVGYSMVTNLLIVRRKSRRLVDCPRFQLWIPEVLFTSWPLTVRSSRQEWVPTHLPWTRPAIYLSTTSNLDALHASRPIIFLDTMQGDEVLGDQRDAKSKFFHFLEYTILEYVGFLTLKLYMTH